MKGNVYFHSQFPFYDGQFGEKLFVVLNEPTTNQPYLVAKTTSKIKHHDPKEGCNQAHSYFYVPKGNSCFPENTFIQLHEIYEFSKGEFLKGSMEQNVISYKGGLPQLTVSQLINCIKKLKEDISEKHFKLIINS